MARLPTSFSIEKQLSTTPVNIVNEAAPSTQSVVTTLSFFNTSATEFRLVTIYRIPSGGTAGTTNIIAEGSIAPRDSWVNVEILSEVFTNGMFAQAEVDAGTDVNVNCSGDIFSS
jgi:hypothetical protein